MTKKNFFLRTVAAVAVCLAVFTSCDKDPVEPPETPPDASEIVGSGHGTFAVLSSNDNATIIGGTSWVEVKSVKNNQSSTKKYEVQLKDSLKHLKSEVIVPDFTLGDAAKTFSYKQTGSKTEQGYITVKDSVLTINFTYGSNLSFSVDLTYQSATFDDGKSKKALDYLGISEANVVVGNYSLTDLEQESVGNTVYLRKKYTQYVAVNMNGETYTLNISIILKKDLGDAGNDIQYSELVNSGIDVIEQRNFLTIYDAWITVDQHLANGNTNRVKFTAPNLEAYIDGPALGNKTVPDLNISNTNQVVEFFSRQNYGEIGEYVKVEQVLYKYSTFYTYFSIWADVVDMEVTYFDGTTTIKFPSPVHENLSSSFVIAPDTDGDGIVQFTHTVSGDFGNTTHVSSRSFNLTVQ